MQCKTDLIILCFSTFVRRNGIFRTFIFVFHPSAKIIVYNDNAFFILYMQYIR